MKKIIIILGLIVVIGGGVWYFLSGADEFIRTQIEKQGTQYLGTEVSVSRVSLALREGRMTITELEVDNPEGFSDEDAFSFDSVVMDLGGTVSEPYQIEEIHLDAPQVLYEVDANGRGNLVVLKNNLQSNLPEGQTKQSSQGEAPLVIVDKVTVSNVKLMINFEKLQTGELDLDKKAYEVTLPTFTAGPIGTPDGMPANEAGVAIMNEMLDNIIARAKDEARNVVKDKAREKIEKEKDKLLEKAEDKLKGLIDKGSATSQGSIP